MKTGILLWALLGCLFIASKFAKAAEPKDPIYRIVIALADEIKEREKLSNQNKKTHETFKWAPTPESVFPEESLLEKETELSVAEEQESDLASRETERENIRAVMDAEED